MLENNFRLITLAFLSLIASVVMLMLKIQLIGVGPQERQHYNTFCQQYAQGISALEKLVGYLEKQFEDQ